MDQHKLLTLQTTLDSCTALFKTLFDGVGIKQLPTTIAPATVPTTAISTTGQEDKNKDENELIILNKFHLYGDTNIDQVFNSIDLQLQTIKFTCQQYRQWDSTEREASKFLHTQRLFIQLQQRSNLISKTIFDCSLIGKIYLNQQLDQQKKQQTTTNENSTPSTPSTSTTGIVTGISKNVEIKRKLGLLAGKLQEMTNELNQKYSTFTVLDDLLALLKNDTPDTNPESYVSCNISSSTFLLDIDIFNNGEIKEVKLAHLSLHDPNADAVPAEQQFNDELTVSLKNDIKDFAQRVVRICDLDLLFRKYKYCDLQKAFSILQSDFLNISISSKKKYNNEIDNKGFGDIKLDCCGILIVYFNPLIDQLSGKHGPYSIMIEMESSAVTSSTDQESEYSRLSLKSLLNTTSSQTTNFDENECFDNEPLSLMLDQDCIFSPVRLVLKLNYPMVITNDQLLNILNLSKQYQPQSQQQSQPQQSTIGEFKQPNNNDQIKKYSIQNQLINGPTTASSTVTTSNDCFDNNVFDTIQRYYYTGEYNLGVEISRVPISHPTQVYPTIQLLRQQLTFNILFKSCFSDLNGNNSGNGGNGKFKSINTVSNSNIPIFEVTSNPPVSINLIFLHPTEMNFNSIDILIGNNGELNALYFDNTSSNQPNLSKSKLFTKLLSKSCSISVSIACFFKQKN